MHEARFQSHDVQLASFDGERVLLLLLWSGVKALTRNMIGLMGRGFALMPGPQSLS